MLEDYVCMSEAIDILKQNGVHIYTQLFQHYVRTGRGPKDTIMVGTHRFYNKYSLAKWTPMRQKRGPKGSKTELQDHQA